MSADLMSWRSRESQNAVIGAILEQSTLPPEKLMFCLTHTHAAPSIRTEDVEKPGGHLIAAYQNRLVQAALESIRTAQVSKIHSTITWRYGRCDLAANRDLPEPGGQRLVCGFNPSVPADDTLLVGRVCDDTGKIVATIVNYACHPTTLAWENRLISPDWVGAMREVVEMHTGAPCLFLQGASGDLAPADQYVADPSIADRHGRRVGFAVLSTLEAMASPGMRLSYEGVVESGAALAMWRHQPVNVSTVIAARCIDVDLPLKPMPTVAPGEPRPPSDVDPVQKERLARQRAVRNIVGEGPTARMPLWAWRIGDAILVGQPNEAYSIFQIELRKRFAPRPLAVMNLVNGSAGYLAPRELYEQNIYQVWQSPFAAGSLEMLIGKASEQVRELLAAL